MLIDRRTNENANANFLFAKYLIQLIFYSPKLEENKPKPSALYEKWLKNLLDLKFEDLDLKNIFYIISVYWPLQIDSGTIWFWSQGYIKGIKSDWTTEINKVVKLCFDYYAFSFPWNVIFSEVMF